MDGAGVSLNRAFAKSDPSLDPFLLLDDFHSNDPDSYAAGFPMHPHRGIETVTYMLRGEMEHGDSLGNKGIIGPGDVQWMTAGKGIIHEEMPHQTRGELWGLQLWINLPASKKMISPRYQEIVAKQIPVVKPNAQTIIKVICGNYAEISGPIKGLATEPIYLDISLAEATRFSIPIPEYLNAFVYVLEGNGYFDDNKATLINEKHMAIYGHGDSIEITSNKLTRFLLIAGKPIRENVAWRGPIVMNTEDELQKAFAAYEKGTFTD